LKKIKTNFCSNSSILQYEKAIFERVDSREREAVTQWPPKREKNLRLYMHRLEIESCEDAFEKRGPIRKLPLLVKRRRFEASEWLPPNIGNPAHSLLAATPHHFALL